MKTISLCMIVKDEALVLRRCLESVASLVDEIIIVDTGSCDDTIAIAKTFTDHVDTFAWCDDFSAARNYAFAQATGDFILWLDADDVILEEDQQKFMRLKASLQDTIDVVMLPYHTSFDENGKPNFVYYRERLLKRSRQFQWLGFLHEAITPQGNIQYGDVAITHRKLKQGDSMRNLQIFEKKKQEGVVFSLREQYYYGKELYYHQRYEDAIHVLSQFLKGQGWKENCIDACLVLSHCYRACGQFEKQLSILWQSFQYDTPRAEILYEIGQYFQEQKNYDQAVYWYELALQCKMDPTTGGFVSVDVYQFLPNLQLSVCYYWLKQYDKAYFHHQQAQKLHPDHPAIQYNEAFFNEQKKQSDTRL